MIWAQQTQDEEAFRRWRKMKASTRSLVVAGVVAVMMSSIALVECKELYTLKKKLTKAKAKEDMLSLWNPPVKKKHKLKGDKPSTNQATQLKAKGGSVDLGKQSGQRNRLCESYKMDPLSDFFLKFATLTSLVTDITEFKRKLKASNTPGWRKKRVWQKKGGGGGDKYLAKDKEFSPSKYNFKNNHLGYKKSRRREEDSELFRREHQDGRISTCYGYAYLSAVDGLILGDSSGRPDLETLQESIMELEDVTLANDLKQVLEDCAMQDSTPSKCPTSTSIGSALDGCAENCIANAECANGELCCANACGGNTCYNPSLQSKYRSDDNTRKKDKITKKKAKKDKCKKSDEFLQCVFNQIGQQVC